MPSKEICEFCDYVRDQAKDRKLVGLPINTRAIEVHVKEFEPDVFYIEAKDGKISIEPYEYNNKDATVYIDKQTLFDIFYKKVSISEAQSSGKLVIDGNGEDLYCLKRNFT